jgi:hypothetical protein
MKMLDANHRVAQLGHARPRTMIPVMTPLPACTAHTRAARTGATRPSRLADWLGLAAAPSFAMMALLTGILGGGSSDMLCSAMQASSPLSGMVPMYLLMSAFHSAPWVRKLSGVRLFQIESIRNRRRL